MAIKYSTQAIEKSIELEQSEKRRAERLELTESCLQWLKEEIQERRDNQLIDSCVSLFHCYSKNADCILAIDGNFAAAKQQYLLAAMTASQIFQLIRAGFSSRMRDGAGPYNFKKHNFNFSKDAILANDLELALSITGENTIEGFLLMRDYEKAQRMLPKASAHIQDEILRAMWSIAYCEQTVFDEALKERIKLLRRQGKHSVTILDSWGLALIQLAQQRDMTCNLNVIELPYKLLDDKSTDNKGLSLPFEMELQAIIQEKKKPCNA